MNRSDIQRVAADLIRAGQLLEQHGDRVWNLTRDWATPLSSGISGPTGKGSISRPTEDAALSDQQDPTMGYHEEFVSTLDKAHPLALSLRDLMVKVTHQAQPEGRKNQAVVCANPKCDTEVVPGGRDKDRPRRGRCERCYKYLTRNGLDWSSKVDEEGAA